MKEKITRSSGNVFTDLGFPPEEAAILAMRADLMAQLRLALEKRDWTQAEAAKALGSSQSRISDLMRGKWDKFILDMLVTLATRAGLHCELKLAAWAWCT
jgi:predicted XRE-type DNA-binding protein